MEENEEIILNEEGNAVSQESAENVLEENVNLESQENKSVESSESADAGEKKEFGYTGGPKITYSSNVGSIDISQGEAKWYILHTFSGYEQTAKANLENVVENGHLHDRITDIVIPEQEIVEEKDGKRKVKKVKTMPSYLFIKMLYGDDLWHTITRTRGVTGFVGPKGRPLPMTEDEIRRMHLEKIAVKFELSVGEKVEIIDGPLQGNVAEIVAVDEENRKCKVNVSLFGRETATEITYDQIRKID